MKKDNSHIFGLIAFVSLLVAMVFSSLGNSVADIVISGLLGVISTASTVKYVYTIDHRATEHKV